MMQDMEYQFTVFRVVLLSQICVVTNVVIAIAIVMCVFILLLRHNRSSEHLELDFLHLPNWLCFHWH